ncbi:MAG: hemerythrin domain-containing protein [Chloroflexi bacterium]|nr:hemerythrin domain-containing protein [Chloroflexota bacterium]
MAFDKSCPGSRSIREPTPGYVNCPECGKEVEIWTDELKATCPGCHTVVLREQAPSCIDWCPHAKECIGPEVYERLRPQAEEDAITADAGIVDIIKREHQQAEERVSLLRAASLCLRLGNLTPGSPVRDKGIDHLGKVLDFFDKGLKLHFRREEEVLFPALEKHTGVEKSPTQLLLGEHAQVWQWYDQLTAKLDELRRDGHHETIPDEVQEIVNKVVPFLQEHIKKENDSLLPLTKRLLGKDELDDVAGRWRSLSA